MKEGAVTSRAHGRAGPAGERRLPVTPTGARTYLELLHGVGAHHRCRLLQLSHLAGGELWLRDALPGGDSSHARDPATGVIIVTRSLSRGGVTCFPTTHIRLFSERGRRHSPLQRDLQTLITPGEQHSSVRHIRRSQRRVRTASPPQNTGVMTELGAEQRLSDVLPSFTIALVGSGASPDLLYSDHDHE